MNESFTPSLTIQNLKKVISIAARLGNVAGKSLIDGRIDLKDIILLPNIAMIFVDLIHIEWSQIIPEAKDLTFQEQNELIEHFKKEFEIPQRIIEVTIEETIAVIMQLKTVIMNLITVFQKNKVS